jgi:glycerol-3-phosphate dehydrogenase
MSNSYDFIIIGCGITGSSIALELSKYQTKVLILESSNDVSMGTTKANSGIIHGGYDPKPETLMARLNVEGSKLTKELAKILNFHYNQVGSLVVGSTESDHKIINELFNNGTASKIPELKLLKTKKEVHDLEPNLNPDFDYALFAPTAAVVAPWEECLAFAQTAVGNGAEIQLNAKVTSIEKDGEQYVVTASDKKYLGTNIINCAGTQADIIYKLALGKDSDKSFEIIPCKGEYYLLDKNQGNLVSHVIFQTPSAIGKGVLVAPTIHNNLIVGPNADYEVCSRNDTSTVQKNIEYVAQSSVRSVPGINFRENIRNFSGIRATLKDHDDFLIGESEYLENFYNFAGIKSPGLSCGPAFGKELVRIMGDKFTFKTNSSFKYYPLPKYFKELSDEDKASAINKDNRFGRVVCRCESITEGEIVRAMHSIIPGKTVDGIKRRTNAGMGRCQGGFCGPKVFELIKKEFNLDAEDILFDRNGSNIVVAKTKGEK